MAFLLANNEWAPSSELVVLLLASSCFYLAGMVLNDVFDVARDREERPGRPLPSGKISIRTAQVVGYTLLITGILLSGLAGWLASGMIGIVTIRCAAIGCALALFVWLYDGVLKSTVIAPWLMGGCRFLNVCLGASTFSGAEHQFLVPVVGLPWVIIWIAASLGILIAGVTLLGRNEANEHQQRLPLIFSGMLTAIGIGGFATIVYCPQEPPVSRLLQQRFPWLIVLIAITVLRNILTAIMIAKPNSIQRGVISVLSSLIFFDAAICYVAQPGQVFFSLAVLALMVPVLLMKRSIKMT
jgi:4-hydroxybenzoate polyprenyltransferase